MTAPRATGSSAPPCDDIGLPLGRWPATYADLRTYAELPDSSHRAALLSDWERLTLAIQDAVGEVAACWLSGSFFTTKAVPSDLDCLYLVRREMLVEARKDPERARFLQAVVGHGAWDNFGLRVDTYFLDWWPRPGSLRGSPARRDGYLQDRGYWDDLWSRSRVGAVRDSGLPRRGYLEVILDGYR